MAWQQLIPSITVRIWPGPYSDLGPPKELDQIGNTPETEFSAQLIGDDAKPLGPVCRFERGTPVSMFFQDMKRLLSQEDNGEEDNGEDDDPADEWKHGE